MSNRCRPTATVPVCSFYQLLLGYACVRYFVDVVVNAGAVAVIVRTSIVPAIFCGRSFGKPVATFVTVELPVRTRVAVEFEFELCAKGPLAVPTNIRIFVTFIFYPSVVIIA